MKIGWIGTGVMGAAMCSHLIKAGYECNVYNRTKNKAQVLIDSGAIWYDDVASLSKDSDVIFTIVGFPEDVEEVYFGEEGIIRNAKKGSILIDMTTSRPGLAVKIARMGKEIGLEVIDAPVTGGDIGAKNASLVIFCGAEQKVFDKALPMLEKMGRKVELMGGNGAGQHAKLSNQIAVAHAIMGTVETLLYAHNAGLDLDKVIECLSQGAGGSWQLQNMGKRIVNRDFDPGFYIKHFVKDMGIALEEAKRMKLSLPGLSLIHQFYVAAMAQGLENEGTQGLYKVLERLNT